MGKTDPAELKLTIKRSDFSWLIGLEGISYAVIDNRTAKSA